MLERFLVSELTGKMTGANSDERTRIFDFEGPCGSFSNRIQMAQALDIIDRETRRRLDIIRLMRNAAAHAHPSLTFDTPEIRAAVWHLIGAEPRQTDPFVIRTFFGTICMVVMVTITGKRELTQFALSQLRADLSEIPPDDAPPPPSPDKSRKRSPRGRPAKGRKGKQPSRPQKSSRK